MHDFGKLVYLDMHKTGSTAISQFLKRCCSLKSVNYDKHAPLKTDAKEDVLYFTSVRNPLSLYISLFRFGCDQKGDAFHRMRKAGLADLYKPDNESFGKWLDFVTTEEGLSVTSKPTPGFRHAASFGIGLMSIRHLTYSLAKPMEQLKACSSAAEIYDVYQKNRITGFVIRNESLMDDLKKLATEIAPEYFSKEKSLKFFENQANVRINASKSGSSTVFTVPPELESRLQEREKLLFEHFYS